MTKSILAVTLGFVTVVGAAHGAPPENKTSAGAGARSFEAVCGATMKRQRACTDVFIPAFVDLRVRLDVPKGIAASAAGGKRQAVIDKALEEWKRDSADPAIERTCKSVDASIPPAAKADVQRLASACLAEAACESFVKCIMPLMEKQLQQRAPK